MDDDARTLLGAVVEIAGRSLLPAEDFAYEFVVYPDMAVRVTSIRHPMTHEWVPFDPPLTVRLDRLADETRLWRDVMQDEWWSDPDRAGMVLEPRGYDYPVL